MIMSKAQHLKFNSLLLTTAWHLVHLIKDVLKYKKKKYIYLEFQMIWKLKFENYFGLIFTLIYCWWVCLSKCVIRWWLPLQGKAILWCHSEPYWYFNRNYNDVKLWVTNGWIYLMVESARGGSSPIGLSCLVYLHVKKGENIL